MAVCKLVETGKLSLDAKVFELLDHLKPLPGATVDPRLATITVRHLLQHRGGWDTAVAGDSLGTAYDAAKEMGISYPPSVPSLNFDPGSRYSYTNLGYLILGQVIEKVSGQTYEDYVKATMLWPMGIRGMQIGRTLWEERGIGESRYFDAPGGKPDESAFAGLGRAQLAYGGFHQPMGLSSGGWVASSPDLLRWVRGIFGTTRQPGYLKPQTLALVAADPSVPGSLKAGEHYGLGWVIAKNTPGGGSWHHTGAIYGSCLSHVERRADGLAFAVTMNSLPHDYGKAIDDLLPRLRSAVDQVRSWPNVDLFDKVASL
jgi:N-acyl-D-amino-acid deacylase